VRIWSKERRAWEKEPRDLPIQFVGDVVEEATILGKNIVPPVDLEGARK